MIVKAVVTSDTSIETVQMVGFGTKTVACTFTGTVPLLGSAIDIDTADIIQGELLASYKMRNPIQTDKKEG